MNKFQNLLMKTALSGMTLQQWISEVIPHRTNPNNTPQLYVTNSQEIMAKNAHVYACIRQISNKITTMPFTIVDSNNKENLPAMRYFQTKLNKEYTFIELMMQVQAWTELRGFCIIYKQPDGTIDILDSDKITTTYYADGSYQLWYNTNGKNIKLEKENYCKVRNFCPFATSTGFTSLQPASQMINIEYSVMNTTQSGFDNGASINGMLTTDQQLNKSQVEATSKFFAEEFAGTNNSGKIPLVHSGFHLEKIGLTPADYDLLKYVSVSKNLISTVLGVPGILINDMEHANYANAKKQEEIFTRNTIIPKLLQREATFDQFLLPLLGFAGLHWDYQWETLPELQEDQVMKATAAKTFIECGRYSPNELRIKDGEEPYDGGDIYVQPGNLFPVGQPKPTPIAAKMTELLKALTNDKKSKEDRTEKLYELFIKRMDPQWRKFTKELNEYFKKQYKSIAANTIKNMDRLIATTKSIDDVDGIVEDEIMELSFMENLRKLSHKYYTAYVSQSGDAAVAEYRLGIEFEMQSKEVIDFIKNSSIKLSENVYGTTTKDVADRIKQILLDNFDKSQKELEELILGGIKDLFEITPSRAELIARTETARANTAGARFAAKQGEMRFKKWIHGGGGSNPRTDHVEIDGEVQPIDNDYSIGFSGPGMGGADHDCNCTCWEMYAYKEDEF